MSSILSIISGGLKGTLKGIREAREDAAERKRQADIEEIKMQKQAFLQEAAKCDEELEKLEKVGEMDSHYEERRESPDGQDSKRKRSFEASLQSVDSESEDETLDELADTKSEYEAPKNKQKKKLKISTSKKEQERKRFTKKEDKFIRLGVEMFGDDKDSWEQIKTCYSNQPSDPLSDRTGKNINDRWRTLNRKAAAMGMGIDKFMKSKAYFIWNPN